MPVRVTLPPPTRCYRVEITVQIGVRICHGDHSQKGLSLQALVTAHDFGPVDLVLSSGLLYPEAVASTDSVVSPLSVNSLHFRLRTDLRISKIQDGIYDPHPEVLPSPLSDTVECLKVRSTPVLSMANIQAPELLVLE